ncbi:hypothetical protein ACVFYP_00605 [Roseomonas sp. F4]
MTINGHKDFIRTLRKNPEKFTVIHYSCQNLNDENEGLSPRITSIGVCHYQTDQTVSFSAHSVAEELGIPRGEVRERFDEVERRLLSNFYALVRDRREGYWVHWNMRNLVYGFEHLSHRYAVLTGENAPTIPAEKRINLNEMLIDRYGPDYAAHTRMKSLMELNGGIPRHFLTGPEEVEAFENNEFLNLHNSTLSKVGYFRWVIKEFLKGSLKTASRGLGIQLDRLFESRHAKALALLGTLVGLGAVALELLTLLF